jgi:hypothetical protein
MVGLLSWMHLTPSLLNFVRNDAAPGETQNQGNASRQKIF